MPRTGPVVTTLISLSGLVVTPVGAMVFPEAGS
jgi:hypothetical protein